MISIWLIVSVMTSVIMIEVAIFLSAGDAFVAHTGNTWRTLIPIIIGNSVTQDSCLIVVSSGNVNC